MHKKNLSEFQGLFKDLDHYDYPPKLGGAARAFTVAIYDSLIENNDELGSKKTVKITRHLKIPLEELTENGIDWMDSLNTRIVETNSSETLVELYMTLQKYGVTEWKGEKNRIADGFGRIIQNEYRDQGTLDWEICFKQLDSTTNSLCFNEIKKVASVIVETTEDPAEAWEKFTKIRPEVHPSDVKNLRPKLLEYIQKTEVLEDLIKFYDNVGGYGILSLWTDIRSKFAERFELLVNQKYDRDGTLDWEPYLANLDPDTEELCVKRIPGFGKHVVSESANTADAWDKFTKIRPEIIPEGEVWRSVFKKEFDPITDLDVLIEFSRSTDKSVMNLLWTEVPDIFAPLSQDASVEKLQRGFDALYEMKPDIVSTCINRALEEKLITGQEELTCCYDELRSLNEVNTTILTRCASKLLDTYGPDQLFEGFELQVDLETAKRLENCLMLCSPAHNSFDILMLSTFGKEAYDFLVHPGISHQGLPVHWQGIHKSTSEIILGQTPDIEYIQKYIKELEKFINDKTANKYGYIDETFIGFCLEYLDSNIASFGTGLSEESYDILNKLVTDKNAEEFLNLKLYLNICSYFGLAEPIPISNEEAEMDPAAEFISCAETWVETQNKNINLRDIISETNLKAYDPFTAAFIIYIQSEYEDYYGNYSEAIRLADVAFDLLGDSKEYEIICEDLAQSCYDSCVSNQEFGRAEKCLEYIRDTDRRNLMMMNLRYIPAHMRSDIDAAGIIKDKLVKRKDTSDSGLNAATHFLRSQCWRLTMSPRNEQKELSSALECIGDPEDAQGLFLKAQIYIALGLNSLNQGSRELSTFEEAKTILRTLPQSQRVKTAFSYINNSVSNAGRETSQTTQTVSESPTIWFKDRYEITARPLGEGGTFKVYSALDKKEGQKYAFSAFKEVNISNKNATMKQMSDSEAEWFDDFISAWKEISEEAGEYAVALIDSGDIPYPYVISELGTKNFQKVAYNLGKTEKLRIVCRVLKALEKIHELGYVHNDVKPENIISVDGEWKLNDFDAISRDGEELAVQKNTWQYVSPELLKGEYPTSKSDIWAVGVMIYTIYTRGQWPFGSEDEYEANVEACEFNRLSVPAPVVDILEKIFRKDPEDRPDAAGLCEMIKEKIDNWS